MNCTKHFDLSSSLTASFVARFMICWVCWLFISELVCSLLPLAECLIKINYGRFCVCFRCLKKVILWSCFVWTRTNSHTIVSTLIWFCYLGRMIYGGKLIWCDLLASKNISSRRNSFGLSLHFRRQNKQIPLKKMIIRTTCKAVNCFSNVARVKYSIVISHLHLHPHLLLLRW